MRKSGQITVFLSLIMVCICSLICGLLESARTAGARWYLQSCAGSAMDSVFSRYHRVLWEDYSLFGLEYGQEAEITDRFEEYLMAYGEGGNWFSIKNPQSEIKTVKRLTDEGGKNFQQEILDFMKFGVWDMNWNLNGEDVLKSLKEADAVKKTATAYKKQARDIMKLEEALKKIADNLERQHEVWNEAEEELDRENGSRFHKKVSELMRLTDAVPGLAAVYKQKADQLADGLKSSRTQLEAMAGDLSPSVLEALRQEADIYEDYVSQDGSRRLEVEALPAMAETNRRILQAAADRAEEVVDIIDSWEPEDENDSLDEGSLWESVRERLDGVRILSVTYEPSEGDKEKQGFLEKVQDMAEKGVLELVLPEGREISNGILEPSQFPTKTSYSSGDLGADPLTTVLVSEYCGRFYADFTEQKEADVSYESEYIVAGKWSDKDNLESTVIKLLGVREGLNILYLISSPEKRQEARALALVVAGSTGLVPLTLLITFFILGVWALGEALMDVKTLLAGGKVPFFKTAASWNLSLDQLLSMGETGSLADIDGGQENSGSGFTYEEYLKLLLLMEKAETKYYRMMDIIQLNIRRKQKDFLMEDCAYSVEIQTKVGGKHLFFIVGMWINGPQEVENEYELGAVASRAY